MKSRFAVSVVALLLVSAVHAAPIVYNVVSDFANLNITASAPWPAAPTVVSITQNPTNVWTYQYENVAHNHDGTYTMLPLGWNATYRGYGLASVDSGSYPSGGNVRAVINAADDPGGLGAPNPALCNYLQSRAWTGAGSIWEPLVIVWRAPQAGTVAVSVAAENMSANNPNNRTNLSLDLWNGSVLSVLDSSPLLAGGSSDSLTAALAVQAGDQIHIWRDSYVDQQGVIVFSGTISLTIPEPASGVLAAAGVCLTLRRRRG